MTEIRTADYLDKEKKKKGYPLQTLLCLLSEVLDLDEMAQRVPSLLHFVYLITVPSLT